MVPVETLNAWGATWSALMLRSLVEATALLIVVLLVWLPLRRRVSSQLSYGLFLLVLAKAAVPLPITLPATVARLSPWRAVDRLVGLATSGAPEPTVAGQPAPVLLWSLPVEIDGPVGSALQPRPVLGADAGQPFQVSRVEAAEPPAPAPLRPTSALGPARPVLSLGASLMLAWAAVVVSLLSRFIHMHVRMSRRLRGAEVIDPASLPMDYDRLCRACRLRTIPLASTPWVAAPAVWGLRHPRVLLPPGLAPLLTPGQLTWVLLHELVHIRRGDAWVAMFQRLVQIAYVFHPAVWLANRLIDVQREFACDDAALALAGDIPRRECGAGFLAVVERASTVPRRTPALGLFGSHTFLRRRLMRILDSRRPLHLRLSTRAALLLGVSALVVLPYVRAQEKPPDTKPRASGASTVPAVAESPASRAIDFRVIRKDDGMPLAGAKVEARAFQGEYTSTLHTTDADGRCRITLPAGTIEWIRVGAFKEGFVPLSIPFKVDELAGQTPLKYTMGLPRGAPIGGVVRDENGRPIAGVRVIPWFMGKAGGVGQERFDSGDVGACTTDSQGRWRAEILPAQVDPRDRILVRLVHPNYASDRAGFSRQVSIEQARAFADVQVMKNGVPIAGTVLDPGDRPVEGAVVTLAFTRNDGDHERTRTDGAGRFRFGHVALSEPRTLTLNVEAAGFAPSVREVQPAAGVPPQEVRLAPGKPLRGRVVDGTGQPVGEAFVKLDAYGPSRNWTWKGQTDSDGRFTWPDGPTSGEVALTISKPPFTRAMGRRVAAGAEDAAITLHQPLRLRGEVVDAGTGKPIESFTLIPGWGPNTPGGTVSWRRDGSSRTLTGGKYDQTGLFPDQGLTRSLRVEAEGYLPSTWIGFKDDAGEIVHDFRLERGTGLSGIVRAPDGRPLEGAEVWQFNRSYAPRIEDGRVPSFFQSEQMKSVTGPDGHYRFKPQDEPSGVVVLHDLGYARRGPEQLARSADLTIAPWGRIEGTLRIGRARGSDQPVEAYVAEPGGGANPGPITRYKARTDAEGRFVIERVIPGAVTVHRTFLFPKGGSLWTHLVHVDVPPGGTSRVSLGGTGRTVVGRIVGPGGTSPTSDLVNESSMLSVPMPEPPTPADFASYDAAKKRAWFAAFRETEEGKAYYQRSNRYGVAIAPDGTFRAEDVPPGRYDLILSLSRKGPGDPSSARASARREVVVPEGDGGRGDEPFDVGNVELTLRNYRTVDVGQAAPALEAKSLDGKPVRLADLRGKYVLLDFWATWCAPCLEETPHLKATYEAFGKDERFAIVGLSLDQDVAAPRQYAEKHGLGWTQAFLGQGDKQPATADFGVQGIPSIWLIGPEGKVIAKGLRGQAIQEAVAQALARPR